MNFNMYSIKDKHNGFTPPIPLKSDAIARRWYKEMAEQSITMKLSKEDFKLYYLGEFDTETGKMFGNDPIKIETNINDKEEVQDEI